MRISYSMWPNGMPRKAMEYSTPSRAGFALLRLETFSAPLAAQAVKPSAAANAIHTGAFGIINSKSLSRPALAEDHIRRLIWFNHDDADRTCRSRFARR